MENRSRMPADRRVGGCGLGWLSSSLFGASAQLVKDRTVVVTLGAGIGILFGVVLFPEKK